MHYRAGLPGWRIAGRLGFTLVYHYRVLFDASCRRFIGVCPVLRRLLAEGDSIAEIKDVIEGSAPFFAALQVYGREEASAGRKLQLIPRMHVGAGIVQ